MHLDNHGENDMRLAARMGLGPFALLALLSSFYAQTAPDTRANWPRKSRQEAEDRIAARIDAIRASAKLPALERAAPSLREVELVCTAAVTGKRVGDPVFGGLDMYVTADLSADVEAEKVVALGTEACVEGPRNPACSGGNPRRLSYPVKSWPRYSVIVERNPGSTDANPAYTVGVARRPSAAREFFAPLFFDVPFKGGNDWKKLVAPECRR